MKRSWRFRWQVLLMLLAASLLSFGILARLADLSLTHDGGASKLQLQSWHQRGERVRQQRLAHEAAAQAQASGNPDCHKVACIALTFDDGPFPATTTQILDTLEHERVPATFFVIGSRVAGNEAILQRMHTDGFEIGNHSLDHPNLTTLSPEAVKQQIDQTQLAIVAAGVPAPTLFRPPYGAVNQTVRDAAGPLTIALWNEDPKDWAATSPAQVLSAENTAIQPGSVVITHDIYHVTADSLPSFIKALKQRNFVFVTVTQMARDYPLIDGQFYGGYRPKLPI